MKAYEVMYILEVMEEEARNAMIDRFNQLIVDNGGNIEKTDFWGKKRLAYEINGMFEGLFVLVTFNAVPATIKELDRVLKINENVMRHMIIRKDE